MTRKTRWLRAVSALFIAGSVSMLSLSEQGCGGCHEGACECADGAKIRVQAAPCECKSACASHGGVCSDDYAGCPIDAGDAGEDDADAWPWPWDAGSG